MTNVIVSKVFSADALAALLERATPNVTLDAFIVPTAEDLLALTEAALSDVDDALALTGEQQEVLRAALRKRLAGALQPEESS